MFTPYLFISVGETGAFFTLRETYLHYIPGAGDMGNAVHNGVYQGSTEIRSFHHFNLSQDPDAAFQKAEDFANANGYKLATTRETMIQEMRDIKRSTAEQLAERERIQQEKNEAWEAERQIRLQERIDLIKSGQFVFGPYVGQKFVDADVGYINWLMNKVEDFEEGSLVRITAEEVIKTCQHMKLPEPDKTMVVGEPKKRLTFDVTVIKSVYFDREGYTGGLERVYVTTMVTSEGACLVVFSPAFSEEVGTQLKIKATVKEHSEYNGQAQTIVQRVAIQK